MQPRGAVNRHTHGLQRGQIELSLYQRAQHGSYQYSQQIEEDDPQYGHQFHCRYPVTQCERSARLRTIGQGRQIT